MKIEKLADFDKFVGRELHELFRAMPDCFDLEVLTDERAVFQHIEKPLMIEVRFNGWKMITGIAPWNV